MKTKRKTTKKIEAPLLSFYPCVPEDHCKAVFLRKIGKPKDGGNSIVDAFLFCMDRICETKRSFSIQDIFQEAKGFDLDNSSVRNLFDRWTQTMLALNRIEEVNGIYDDPIYILI